MNRFYWPFEILILNHSVYVSSSIPLFTIAKAGPFSAHKVYSKSPRIRTYFFESQAEIGSYFKDTKIKFKV